MFEQKPRTFAFFGSSLVSSYWNGAATYYRGIAKALAERGHQVSFFEPNALDRQAHRDIPNPSYAEVVVYEPDEASADRVLRAANEADVLIKCSGVGVLDAFLERRVADLPRKRGESIRIFWDVDAPATLASLKAEPQAPFHSLLPRYDFVLTYGGGRPVIEAYRELGAPNCYTICNALDPDCHHPVPRDPDFNASLSFLGNRLPDREERVEEFFFRAAAEMPTETFLLGGSGWEDKARQLENLRYLDHVGTELHNKFNVSPLAVLNVNRQSMASTGFSPPTRIFEAAGAGACVITDDWPGIDAFLMPGEEVLVVRNTADVVRLLRELTLEKAQKIGDAARRHIIRDHTYAHRAKELEQILADHLSARASA